MGMLILPLLLLHGLFFVAALAVLVLFVRKQGYSAWFYLLVFIGAALLSIVMIEQRLSAEFINQNVYKFGLMFDFMIGPPTRLLGMLGIGFVIANLLLPWFKKLTQIGAFSSFLAVGFMVFQLIAFMPWLAKIFHMTLTY